MPRHPSLGKRLRRQSGSILPILAGHAIAEATGRSSPDSRIGDDVTGDEQQRATTAPPPTPSFPANAVHLVRTNQQLTMQLSQMADQKASILMGATFVVFTLAVGQVRAGPGNFALTLTILATFSFLSALPAVSAVAPRLARAPPPRAADQATILFSGPFTPIDAASFIAAVKARIRTDNDIFEP